MPQSVRLGPLAVFIVVVVAIAAVPAFQTWAEPQLEAYESNLNWPIALAFASDGRIFFAERYTGSIRVIENDVLLPDPYFTLANTLTAGEQGLLGLALHPQYPSTPYVYAYQSYDDPAAGTRYNRVVRFFGGGNVGNFDRVVLAPIPLASIHNGGIIGFGSDGTLYVTTGDAGTPAAAQTLGNRGGKILRVNDDVMVPSDNPFAGGAAEDDYVFTYGHRNVFGLAFHPTTRRVFITENGPTCNDEVNLLVAGGNFGWGPSQSCGPNPPAPRNTNQDGSSPILPIWFAQNVVVPTNAAVYRGGIFPPYAGDLIFGDATGNRLRRLDLEPPTYNMVVGESTILEAPSFILDVESGPDGAIWFTTSSTIYRYSDLARGPVSSFVMSPSPAAIDVPVAFDGTSSADPDGTIVSYSWDFGDGSEASGDRVSHAYRARGAFSVRLTVTDNDSNEHSSTQVLTVVGGPSGEFYSWVALAVAVALGATVTAAVWRRRRRARD